MCNLLLWISLPFELLKFWRLITFRPLQNIDSWSVWLGLCKRWLWRDIIFIFESSIMKSFSWWMGIPSSTDTYSSSSKCVFFLVDSPFSCTNGHFPCAWIDPHSIKFSTLSMNLTIRDYSNLAHTLLDLQLPLSNLPIVLQQIRC